MKEASPVVSLLSIFFLAACGSPAQPDSDASTVVETKEKMKLGIPCCTDDDCLSDECLKSEYGPPFCSRPCDNPQEACSPGEDAGQGESLCVSYENPPYADITDPFDGEMLNFCVPICQVLDECDTANLNWEVCENPKYLGDPLFPNLGTSLRTCQAPSYQGKDPVDPGICDWEKTLDPSFGSEANLCRFYCEYLQKCMEIPSEIETDRLCCEWGCYNRMFEYEGEVGVLDDQWHDEVKCFVDVHGAYEAVGTENFCNQPPKECTSHCGDTCPQDPTPPAAEDGVCVTQ